MYINFCGRALIPIAVLTSSAAAGGALFSATNYAQQSGIIASYTLPPNGGASNVMICGAAAEDFNRDGLIDIFILGGAQHRDYLYICMGPDDEGIMQYEDQAQQWGILGPRMGAGVSVADYDGNGYLDLYVTAQGKEAMMGPGFHRLYKNLGPDALGQFRFEEVADQVGVRFTTPTNPDGYSSSWADIDLDGDLDLFVGGWTANAGGNKLFQNNGDGTFSDITESAIDIDLLETHGFTPRFADVTGNGAPDLLIAADYNTSKLLINTGAGQFVDRTAAANVNQDSNGMGATTADFNNDGRIDWYVSSIKNGVSTTQDGNKLYINQGEGVFGETAVSAGVDDGGWGWGVASGDLDHDGDVDIVETNGWLGGQWINEQSYIFLNDGDGTSFTESALAVGVSTRGMGRGTILFDHDNDGDLDIAVISADIRFALYRNDHLPENTNHWVKIRLDTSMSARNAPDGVGAHVIITTGSTVQHRWVQANSGYLSQGPIMAHAGLGSATTIDRVEIIFPSGATRVIEDIPADAAYTFAICDADMTGDGLLDIFDVFAFLADYNNELLSADLTGDGAVDFADILEYIDLFSLGCPGDR